MRATERPDRLSIGPFCLWVGLVCMESTGSSQRPDYGEIRGHKYQPGVRQVLRINRYTRGNPRADAPHQVDIRDRVVETASSPGNNSPGQRKSSVRSLSRSTFISFSS